jgi:hypothetical protein
MKELALKRQSKKEFFYVIILPEIDSFFSDMSVAPQQEGS